MLTRKPRPGTMVTWSEKARNDGDFVCYGEGPFRIRDVQAHPRRATFSCSLEKDGELLVNLQKDGTPWSGKPQVAYFNRQWLDLA